MTTAIASPAVLTHATRQWSSRPDDESFASLAELHADALNSKTLARTTTASTRGLRVIPTADGDLSLNGSTGARAAFTNWSFGQLARSIAAPAAYLATLPAALAAEALNYGLDKAPLDHTARLLLDVNPEAQDTGAFLDAAEPAAAYTLRALTSEKYTRIFDADVTSRLIRLEERGPWQPAPAAFDGKRGLYRGDRDMFAFLVDSGRRIFEKGPGGGLSRGFFVSNSEVGAASFKLITFLYEYVCGNHRVWGASAVKELSIRHVGDADGRAWGALAADLKQYAEGSAADDEAKIERATRHILGKDKDAVLDAVFGLRLSTLTQADAAAAFDIAETRVDRYGDPRSAWAFSGGLTELSQTKTHADARVDLDRAAGRILEVAF